MSLLNLRPSSPDSATRKLRLKRRTAQDESDFFTPSFRRKPESRPRRNPVTGFRPVYSLKDSAKGSQRGSQTSSQKIVTMMSENPSVTIDELARNLRISPRTVKKQIKGLKDNGTIKRIGPDFGGHWEVVSQ